MVEYTVVKMTTPFMSYYQWRCWVQLGDCLVRVTDLPFSKAVGKVRSQRKHGLGGVFSFKSSLVSQNKRTTPEFSIFLKDSRILGGNL